MLQKPYLAGVLMFLLKWSMIFKWKLCVLRANCCLRCKTIILLAAFFFCFYWKMGTISVNFLSLRTYLVISRRNRSVLVSSLKLFHIKKRPTGQWPCMVKKYKELRWWLYHPLPENALDSFLELTWFLSALIHIWTVR